MFPDLPPAVALVLGLFMLVKGAGWLVDGGVSIARRLHVSPMMIGLTIVAWGTSLPELVVTTMAAADDNPGLALGNALGSNVANIGLVLGVTALILPSVLGTAMRLREVGWILVSLFGLWGVLYWESGINRVGGVYLIVLFFVFYLHLVKATVEERLAAERMEANKETLAFRMDHAGRLTDTLVDVENIWMKGEGVMRRDVLKVLVAFAAVAAGSHFTVDGAEAIARSLGVSDRVIGLSIVAIGTSLPELAAGIASALKGHKEIGLGNVVGSNVFNLLVAVGAASIVRPFGETASDGVLVEETLGVDLPLVLAFSLAAVLVPRLGASARWKGGALLLGYIAFLWAQF